MQTLGVIVPTIEIKQKAYAEIERKFVCPHLKREVRRRTIKDGRQTYVSQCIRCGHTSSPIKVSAVGKIGKIVPEYDDKIQEKWRALKNLAYEAAREELKPQLKKEYSIYLRSEKWKEIRNKIISRCKNICEVCESAPAEQVHHLTYVRLGNEELNDLLGVCGECHELIHSHQNT